MRSCRHTQCTRKGQRAEAIKERIGQEEEGLWRARGGGSMPSAMGLLTCISMAASIDCKPKIDRHEWWISTDSLKAGVHDLPMHIGQRDRALSKVDGC